MSRRIIFGDIHGCYLEWQDLLSKLEISPDDQLISVGDIVCKGPSTTQALDMAMNMPNLQCIVGNHELALLLKWKSNDLNHLTKEYQRSAIKEMGNNLEKYMCFMDTWPFYLDLPDCLIVHAGIQPNKPLHEQDPFDLTHIRHLKNRIPWYEHYKQPKLIVHGHWARQGLVIRNNVVGLDSGCVYGRTLSALVLPERQIISVKAREVYDPV